jgi:hypothetical protein
MISCINVHPPLYRSSTVRKLHHNLLLRTFLLPPNGLAWCHVIIELFVIWRSLSVFMGGETETKHLQVSDLPNPPRFVVRGDERGNSDPGGINTGIGVSTCKVKCSY